MPIRDRSKYPANWQKLSLKVRHDAGWRCEQCGRAQGTYWRRVGSWWMPATAACGDATRIVLTVHHKRPVSQGGGHELSNLQCLCQACHLEADRPLSLAHAAETRAQRRTEAKTQAGQEALL